MTIQRRGTIGFSPGALESLGHPGAVELMFDEDNAHLLGFRPAEVNAEHSYPVRPLGKSGAGLISAKAFCDFLDIPRDVARRWLAQMQDDMLVIDTSGPATEIHSKRGSGTDSKTFKDEGALL